MLTLALYIAELKREMEYWDYLTDRYPRELWRKANLASLRYHLAWDSIQLGFGYGRE